MKSYRHTSVACQVSHIKLLIKVQNSTLRQILDMPWYVQNFHVYKEIELPHLNDFIQTLTYISIWH